MVDVATPSTRRLSEVARHVIYPTGIVSSGWNEVEDQCSDFGDEFDEWQRGAGRVILGRREDGIYAATIGGITLSIPRQVAKTFLVGRIVFALCVLFPGLKVIWTAHRTRTATNTFKALQGFARRARVAPHIEHIRTANGEQEIAFTNGSVIMFGAREQGFGRGFDEVDIEVFDEAQILTEKALEDMVAATNQSRHPHGALLFYMGTPPRPVDPGEAFSARRDEALAGKSEDAVYIECAADPDADPDDQEQWAKANPSFPHRTPLRSMLRLRKNLPSVEAWKREALGVWDEKSLSDPVVSSSEWAALESSVIPSGNPDYYSLTMSPERIAFIGVCIRESDDDDFLDIAEGARMDDSRKVVDWFVARKVSGKRVTIAIDSRDPAAALVNELRANKVKVNVMTQSDSGRACTGLLDAIEGHRISHCGQPIIASALRIARKKPIGKAGLWEWDLDDPTSEIAALRAITLARFGASLKSVRSAGTKPKVLVM